MPEATGPGRAPGLREMTEGDLDVVARLEGELFGAEAWSRDLLAAELAASHGPRRTDATSSSSPKSPTTMQAPMKPRIALLEPGRTGHGSWATPGSTTPAV